MSNETSTGNSEQPDLDTILRDNPPHIDHGRLSDFVHSEMMDPARGVPKADSAHDSFWDCISLTPESMKWVKWVMSDFADTAGTSRIHAESFADHYGRARQIYLRQTPHEQAHISLALVVELSKVASAQVREAIVGHLRYIEEGLAKRVAAGMAFGNTPSAAKAAMPVEAMQPSAASQMIGKMEDTLKGRAVGILIADGSDGALIRKIEKAATDAGASVKIIAPREGEAKLADGSMLAVDGQLAGSPSLLFDAVAIVLSDESAKALAQESTAIDFARDAFGHLKAIAADQGGQAILKNANVGKDAGVVDASETDAFVAAAKSLQWNRKSVTRQCRNWGCD